MPVQPNQSTPSPGVGKAVPEALFPQPSHVPWDSFICEGCKEVRHYSEFKRNKRARSPRCGQCGGTKSKSKAKPKKEE